MALTGATALGKSGPRSNGNNGVLHILQSFRITGALPSDCLVSNRTFVGLVLHLRRDAVSDFYICCQLGRENN